MKGMQKKFLSKEWEKLVEGGLPKIDVKKGDVKWLLELLGWKEDVERRK